MSQKKVILDEKEARFTVLEYLRGQGKIKNEIEAGLNDPLKTNISIHLLRKQYHDLLDTLNDKTGINDLLKPANNGENMLKNNINWRKLKKTDREKLTNRLKVYQRLFWIFFRFSLTYQGGIT